MDVFLKGRLIEEVLEFFDEKDRLHMGLISKKVYHKHVPLMYKAMFTREGAIVFKLNKGIPKESLEKYVEDGAMKKLNMLGFVPYQTIIDSPYDWCSDFGTGQDIEYKAGFTGPNGHKCWGIV